jgi:hypothetical protein
MKKINDFYNKVMALPFMPYVLIFGIVLNIASCISHKGILRILDILSVVILSWIIICDSKLFHWPFKKQRQLIIRFFKK